MPEVITVVPGDTAIEIELDLSYAGFGGVTGQTPTLQIRNSASATSYLDFADNTFKTSGWTTQTVNMTEIGSTGRYRYLYNSSLCAAMVDGFKARAEMRLTGTYAAIVSSLIVFRANASGATTIGQIADAVWDEVLSGHLTAGTTGAKLNSISNSAGEGTVSVNSDYGGTDNLTATTTGGIPVDNATIEAFLATDYSAGRTTDAYRKGLTTTNVLGRMVAPLQLDPASYTLFYFKEGYISATKAVTVT